MDIPDSGEHLTVPAIELAAMNAETLHLLRCSRCAMIVLRYAETRENVPFDQYPSAD